VLLLLVSFVSRQTFTSISLFTLNAQLGNLFGGGPSYQKLALPLLLMSF
jgi:hypothetical protein